MVEFIVLDYLFVVEINIAMLSHMNNETDFIANW